MSSSSIPDQTIDLNINSQTGLTDLNNTVECESALIGSERKSQSPKRQRSSKKEKSEKSKNSKRADKYSETRIAKRLRKRDNMAAEEKERYRYERLPEPTEAQLEKLGQRAKHRAMLRYYLSECRFRYQCPNVWWQESFINHPNKCPDSDWSRLEYELEDYLNTYSK